MKVFVGLYKENYDSKKLVFVSSSPEKSPEKAPEKAKSLHPKEPKAKNDGEESSSLKCTPEIPIASKKTTLSSPQRTTRSDLKEESNGTVHCN